MLRNLQRQFPIGTQPIVKIGRLRRRLQFLDDTDVVGSPPRKLAPSRGLRPLVMATAILFAPQACATARTALGSPMRRAISV
jgi:hypothetical protein